MAAATLDAAFVVLLGVVTISDLRTRLIPDGALAAGLLLAIAVSVVVGADDLPERLLAGGGAAAFLLVAALVRPEGMGLGDVKLAGVIGVYLGPGVLAALTVAFAAGSIAGVVLLARHGWEARRRTIPFAPFLALGALAALAAGG